MSRKGIRMFVNKNLSERNRYMFKFLLCSWIIASFCSLVQASDLTKVIRGMPTASSSKDSVTIYWTDKGINQWQAYKDRRNENFGTQFDSIFNVTERGKILVLMPYDNGLPSTEIEEKTFRQELKKQINSRISTGISQGVQSFEIRTVQMIGYLGYMEAWDQQLKVKEFSRVFLETLNEVKTDLQKKFQVECIGAVGSNGAYVATENIPQLVHNGKNPIDELNLFDGRAYVSQTQKTIEALHGNVTIINTAGDIPALEDMIGNFNATKRLKSKNPSIRIYWTDPRGLNIFTRGHLGAMERSRDMWVKEYNGRNFSKPIKISGAEFIDSHLLKKNDLAEKNTGGVSMRMSESDASYMTMWNQDFPEPPGTKRVFVSLRVLSQTVFSCLASGKRIPEKIQTLFGISYIEGYIVQDKNPKDIVLFGLVCDARPNLRLDDLIVNMRNIANSVEYPYCSLDPKRENTIALQRLFSSAVTISSTSQMKAFFKKVQDTVGPQEIVIGGVPRNSRHAHVMIDADYHMKKVSQAHISIDGVTSYIDHSLNEAVDKIMNGKPVPASGVSMARFWFHIGKGSPKFQQGTDIVAIDHCNVVILTEKQKATASGELVDVIEDDPYAIAFANEMSEYLSIPGFSTVPSYADLENLFRLRALLLSMDFQSLFSSVGWSFSSFIPNYKYLNEKPMDSSMDGLANYKEWTHEISSGLITYTYSWFPIICGGVGMDMTIDKDSYREDIASRLSSFRMAALKARKSKNILFWTLAVQ